MKRIRQLVVLASVSLWFVLAGILATAQITPLQDAYTNTATATTNYGTAATLGVVSTGTSVQTTYIQFDLLQIPAGYTGANIAKASLKLYVNAVTTGGTFNIDYVAGSWGEKTITASVAPALGANIVSNVSLTTASVHQYVLIDLTPAVQAWLNGTEPSDGIALVANSGLNANLDSKENTGNSQSAELDVVYASGIGTITGVSTASGSGLIGGGTTGNLNLSLITSCSTNQVLRWNGTAWACGSTAAGTITGVTAGTALTGGGTAGKVTLNVDTTKVVTGVVAGAGLTGGGTGGAPTLNVDTTKIPQLASANTFTGNQTVNGNLSATGVVTGSSFQIGNKLFDSGSYSNANAFLGFSANTTSTGADNTGVGQAALISNTAGGNNTGSGVNALALNTTGNNNTAAGVSALQSNVSGSNNTALGYNAGPDSASTALANATAIGANAVVSASNALVLGGTGVNAVKVGIGTATPAATLDVRGNAAFTGPITFAAGQTFPGTGTITGVTAGTALTGGGTSGGVTLNVDTTKVVTGVTAGNGLTGGGTGGSQTLSIDPAKIPTLSAANTFNNNQTIVGNLTVTSGVNASVLDIGGNLFAFGSPANLDAFQGFAGNFVSTGIGNTGTGASALAVIADGVANTADGAQALASDTHGSNNTATGIQALFGNSTGSHNTAVGAGALTSNSTGSFNTAVGDTALGSNFSGTLNTAVGYNAGPLLSSLSNATAIGANALVSESNAMVLGSINGVGNGTADTSIGIGTNIPSSTLDVEATAPGLVGPVLLLKNKAPVQTAGFGNSVDFRFALDGGSSVGNPNAFMRIAEDGNNQYGAWISFATMADGGAGAGAIERMRIRSDGFVGIGTSTPDALLSVNGGADKVGGGSWATFSDRRLKDLDGDFSAGLGAIMQLHPIRYRYKDENGMGIHDHDQHIGFVAQEVQKVIPEAVTQNSKGYLLVNNDPILWTMLNAIKQQQKEIEDLRTALNKKSVREASLEAKVARLNSQVKSMQTVEKTAGQKKTQIRPARVYVAHQ